MGEDPGEGGCDVRGGGCSGARLGANGDDRGQRSYAVSGAGDEGGGVSAGGVAGVEGGGVGGEVRCDVAHAAKEFGVGLFDTGAECVDCDAGAWV